MRRVSPRAPAGLLGLRSAGGGGYRGLLPDAEPRGALPRFSRLCGGAWWRVVLFVVLFAVLFAALLALALSSSERLRHGPAAARRPPGTGVLGRPELDALAVLAHARDAGGHRRLRIFLAADAPHLNLCKAIMSAVALGYPLPTLLNWNGEYNRPEWHLAGSHVAKLESLLAVVEELLAAADSDDDADENDLALFVDAYDVWFQLPPSVLIRRYHQLNREADERVRDQWRAAQGRAPGFPVQPPRQFIVVTSAKDCQPGSESGSSPRYDRWPVSPMPKDMYGKGVTDRTIPLLFDPARKYKNFRPRCINSGMIMGTMGAFRRALERCKSKIETVARSGRQLWSDQALLGEVIGDQEMWREWARTLGGTWNGTASEYDLSGLSPAVRSIAEAALLGQSFEFGIGLDYNFTTIPPTCSAEEDGYFVKLNDAQAVKEESRKARVPGGVRVNGIPKELRRPNEEEERDAASEDPLSSVSWGDVPLYTDFYFGVTPVGIHHNAYVDDLKPWRLQNWWNRTWFYPRLAHLVSWSLRPLQEDGNQESVGPLARLPPPDGEGTEELVYWPARAEQRARKVTVFQPASEAEPARFVPIHWDGVCQEGDAPWYDALFGAERGQWKP